MGQVTKYPKKRNVDYWKLRGQLCFFSALEFGPLPNLDWSQPQMRSESLIWLCWCCLAHDKIAFGYPITTYGNRATPPNHQFSLYFPWHKTSIYGNPHITTKLQGHLRQCPNARRSMRRRSLPSSWSNSFSTYLSEFWREFQSDWIPIG